MADEQLVLDGMPEPPPAEPTPTDAEVIESLRRAVELVSTVAGQDVRDIAVALGLGDYARPYSPHDVVHREIIPAIRDLARLASATLAIKPAGDTGIPEMDLGNGRKAQLAGRKLPDDVARSLGLKRGA